MSSQPAGLNVDQAIDYAADQFEIELNDSQAWRAGMEAAAIATGLLDPYLVPEYVDAIVSGVVDERELYILPDSFKAVFRGRNAMALAADTNLFVTYAASPNVVVAETPPASIPGFPGLQVIPGVTSPLVLPGPWTAQRIATDLCQRAGLGCAYGSPDYQLREDFAVNGSVTEAIQQLVQPFSNFESSKADMWVENGVYIVRHRGEGTPSVLTLDVHDARISEMVVLDSDLPKIRVLRMVGSMTGANLNVAADPGDATRETTDETEEGGVVTSRVITRERYRILDNAVKSQTIETYEERFTGGISNGLELVSRKETSSDWDDLVLTFPNQIVNFPKEHTRTIVESGPDAEFPEFWSPLKRTRIRHAYNGDGYLKMQEVFEEDWEKGDDINPAVSIALGHWEPSGSEIKQYRENGAGMYQITTTQISAEGTPGQTRRTTANGTPPGGPGRSVAGNVADNTIAVTYGVVISQDPLARDVTISNRSLLPEHALKIKAQAIAASGALEREIKFTAAGMPWLRRGQFILLEGLISEGPYEEPITFQPALVTAARLEYREGPDGEPSYKSYVSMVYWVPVS